jgi:hypothetical protein
MPLTLNAGLSKKLGLPEYGSLGVSCHVEVEVDSSLLADAHALQERIRQVYGACHQAVQDELQRQQQAVGGNESARSNSNGQPAGSNHTNGQPRDQPRGATVSQVRAIEAIARRQKVDLPSCLRIRFAVDQPDQLSITQASSLIDDLKRDANGSGGPR